MHGSWKMTLRTSASGLICWTGIVATLFTHPIGSTPGGSQDTPFDHPLAPNRCASLEYRPVSVRFRAPASGVATKPRICSAQGPSREECQIPGGSPSPWLTFIRAKPAISVTKPARSSSFSSIALGGGSVSARSFRRSRSLFFARLVRFSRTLKPAPSSRPPATTQARSAGNTTACAEAPCRVESEATGDFCGTWGSALRPKALFFHLLSSSFPRSVHVSAGVFPPRFQRPGPATGIRTSSQVGDGSHSFRVWIDREADHLENLRILDRFNAPGHPGRHEHRCALWPKRRGREDHPRGQPRCRVAPPGQASLTR